MESDFRNTQLSGPVYMEQPHRGVIIFTGNDRIDFLQRQTTNDASQVNQERILTTVLTSPTGRILDVLHLIEEEHRGEAQIHAISLPGRSTVVTAYFKSRIFFMDKVDVRDASNDYAHFDLAGQGLGHVLGQIGIPILPDDDRVVSAEFNGSKLKVFRQNHRLGIGFQVIVARDQGEQFQSWLTGHGVEPLSQEGYEVMRVEAGIPGVERELTEEHTPLEVNLQSAISNNKGCYTGQEVIARQMNYDKVTRKLVGLFLDKSVTAGSQLEAEGKPAGKLTSFVFSPRFGPIALAMVRRPYHQDGQELTVKDGELTVNARLKSLPFLG